MPTSAEEIFSALPCAAVPTPGRHLESATPGESVEVAVNRMRWAQVGALPVLESGRLVGCFAEEDLLRVLAERLADAPAGGRLSLWAGLLAGTSVAETMTPVDRLPMAAPGQSLLEALRATHAADGQHGRYLFVLDAGESGEALRLASFRDVTRLLTRLYDGDLPDPALVPEEAARRASVGVQRLLAQPLGAVRLRAPLGHDPSVVGLDASVSEAIAAMSGSGRGYVLVALGGDELLGIFTRRDLVRACAGRHVDLSALRLSRLMTPRVRTVTETDTLCGLLKQMALASCRHMPLVDDWDRPQAVISMWEAVHLLLHEKAAA